MTDILKFEVYALDMFHSFFRADPMNAIEGHRYRDDLLRKGGSEDEMKTLVEYLGRKPESEAFCLELGLL